MSDGERFQVRLADVAAAAGMSVATVSRVLGGSSHKVNVATRRRVEAAAERLAYKANPIARALRLSMTGSIGIVVPSIGNPFFTELVEQVEHHLTGLDLNLYLCDARDSVELEARRLRSFAAGAVDGILIVPCHATESAPAVHEASQLVPLVQIDRQIPDLKIPWVGVEDTTGIHDIMHHLADLDVQSLALVTSMQSSLSSAVRTASVRSNAAELGISIAPNHVLDGRYSIEEGTIAAERLVALGGLPDAIVCADDLLAIGVIAGLRKHGFRIPEDVLVTGFDDVRFASYMVPSLTTVRQPLSRIAAEAVRLLQEDGDSTREGIRIALPGKLMVRGSTTRGEHIPQRPA